MIKLYLKQSWMLIRQNKLFTCKQPQHIIFYNAI